MVKVFPFPLQVQPLQNYSGIFVWFRLFKSNVCEDFCFSSDLWLSKSREEVTQHIWKFEERSNHMSSKSAQRVIYGGVSRLQSLTKLLSHPQIFSFLPLFSPLPLVNVAGLHVRHKQPLSHVNSNVWTFYFSFTSLHFR